MKPDEPIYRRHVGYVIIDVNPLTFDRARLSVGMDDTIVYLNEW